MSSHRSRLAAAMVDVPRDDYDKTVIFWSAALAKPPEVELEDPDYASFGETGPGFEFCVQAVGDSAGRVHLDIETDDVDAEVSRLVALGATEVQRVHTWVIMRDPVGIIFCVVRVQLPDAFAESARTWTA